MLDLELKQSSKASHRMARQDQVMQFVMQVETSSPHTMMIPSTHSQYQIPYLTITYIAYIIYIFY